MTPEKQLLAQAQNARIACDLRRRNTPIDSSGVVVGYNADYHLDEVQLWDGSIRYAEGLTNGARATEEGILYSSEGHVESPNHIKRPSTLKRSALKVALHNLRVLAITRSGNSYQFYAGSESQRLESCWISPDLGEGVYLDPEYQVRIDNLNPKSKKGWAITSLWGKDSNLFLAPDSGLAISIDSKHTYNVEINHYDNMRVAGAYFFGQNWSEQLTTLTSNKSINASLGYNERGDPTNMFSDTNITERVEVSSNSVELDLFGGQVNHSSSYEPLNYNYMIVGYGVKSPFTHTKSGGTKLSWFSGSKSEKASYSRTVEGTRLSNGNSRGNLNITINSSGSFNFTQKLQTVYKDQVTESIISHDSNYNRSGIATRHYDGTTGGNVIDDSTPYRQSMSDSDTFTNTLIQIMPGVSENTFGRTSNLNSSESGILGPHIYYGIYFEGNFVNPVVLQLDNVQQPGLYALDITGATLLNSSIFAAPISTSGNSAAGANPYIFSLSYNERIAGNNCIPNILSPDSQEGIIYIEEYELTNTSTPINGRRSFETIVNAAIEGRYYYRKTSNEVIKKVIQFSGSRYANPSAPYQNVNSITEAFELVFNDNNHVIPETIGAGSQLTYNAAQDYNGTYSRLNGFAIGQSVEYGFINGDNAYSGRATILTINGTPTIQGEISFRIDSLNKINTHDAAIIFSLRGNGITLQSLGYRVLNRYTMNSYDSAPGITLKNGILYAATVLDDEPMYNGQPYKVFVDSYELLPYGTGDTLYLERQPFKFINCPAIPTALLEELETVIFAYSK